MKWNRPARLVTLMACVTLSAFAAGCADEAAGPTDTGSDSSSEQWAVAWDNDVAVPETVEPAAMVELTAKVTYAGNPMANVLVNFEVVRGGGEVDEQTAHTGVDGRATVTWTVGLMPVTEAVRASIEEAPVFADQIVEVQPAAALAPIPFGDVGAVLAGAGVEASTEGLVFDDEGILWLAAGGNLIRMEHDGSATVVPVGGDSLDTPLGMAWDYLRRVIWVADKASIRSVSISEAEDGTVTATSSKVAALTGLVTPNSVAIKDNKYVYFTDSCTGGVYRFEPEADPVAMQTVAQFDVVEKGGPNGIAFDVDGRLWVTTENVALLCPESGADVTLNKGSLYMLDVSSDGAGFPVEPEPRLEGFAMYGDGLAFDQDGNMYVIFDSFDGFTLTDTSVWLVPADAGADPVKVVSVPAPGGMQYPDRLIANIAWGWDEFGVDRMYLSLLAVVMLTSERGAMTVDVGTSGLSLLPSDLPD